MFEDVVISFELRCLSQIKMNTLHIKLGNTWEKGTGDEISNVYKQATMDDNPAGVRWIKRLI